MKRESIYKIFSNIPTLRTERLSLRALHPIDAEDMYDYAKREDVTKYLTWKPHLSIGYTKDYLHYIQNRYTLGDFYDWAVIHKDSRRMIGTCGFTTIDTANNSAEIGYVINPDFHGMGLGTEAVERVIEFGFEELGLNRIQARFMQDNIRSRKLMERVGMTFEGFSRNAVYVKGEYRTVGICSILRSEWNEPEKTVKKWQNS